jgi:chaperonin cofactor prefoldin
MEHLQSRLEQLKQQEASLIMQLDELRVLIQAYQNTLENDKGVG